MAAAKLIEEIRAIHDDVEAIPAEVAGFSGVARIMDLEVYYRGGATGRVAFWGRSDHRALPAC